MEKQVSLPLILTENFFLKNKKKSTKESLDSPFKKVNRMGAPTPNPLLLHTQHKAGVTPATELCLPLGFAITIFLTLGLLF